MKHLLIAFGVLAALGIAAGLLAPGFIDWNQYKGEITRRVEQATGRRLAIDGPIQLALLPTPRLYVGDVRIASLPGSAKPDLLRLKGLEAHVAFAALFAGRIQIESLALIGPQLALERLADGRGNWQEPPARAAARPPESETGAPGAASPVFPSWLQLDRLTIEDGSLTYRDAKSGKLWSLNQIAGGLNAGSALGPFRAQGRAQFGKLPITLDASLERLGGRRPASVGLRVGITGAQLDFGGSVSEAKDGLDFSGKLRATSPNLSAAMIALGWSGLAALPALNQSMALDGNLSTGGQKLVLSGLSLRLGESEATGSLTYQPGAIGRAAATLSLTRFDLEKWLPREPGQAEKKAEASAAKRTSTGPLAFTLPLDFEATLDVALDGLLYKGGVVRQIRFGAALNKGELALTQFTAEFPGGSDLTLYGALRTPGGKPVFTGNIEAASDNLRAVLDWLKLDVMSVPAERLRRLSLSAALKLTPQELELRDVDAELDSTHLVGAATVLMQERPAFGASIAIDRLNLDAYLPQAPAARAPSATASPTATAPAPAPAPPIAAAGDLLGLLGGFDANLRLSLDELIYREEPIRGIRLDGTVDGGALTLHAGSVDDLAGLKGTLKGRLAGPRAAPTLELAFDLSDPELIGLLRYAGWRPAVPIDQLGAAALKGEAKGTLDKLTLALDGSLLDGAYKLSGSIGDGKGGPLYDVDVSAQQPHLGRVLRLFSSDAPAGELGAIELSGHVSGDATKLTVSGLKSQSPLFDATGDLSIAGFPHRHTLSANLELASSRPTALLSLAGAPAPEALDRLGRATATVKLSGDREGYALDGKLALAGGTLAVVGKSARSASGPSFTLALDAEEPELATLLGALLPGYQPSEAKLGALQLHAKAAGTADKFALSDIQAKLGPVELKGTAAATLGGAKPALALKLAAGAIALDPFLPAAQVGRPPPKRARGQATTAARRWPTTPLGLDWLKPLDAELSLSATSLDYGQYHLEGAELAATLKDAVLTLGSLSGKLYGGELKLAGSLAAAAEPKASLSLHLEGAQLGEAGLKLGQVELREGTLAATAELAASGTSELALLRRLSGNGTLDMEGGAIKGLDLSSANARLSGGGRVDLLSLLRAATSGGETQLKRLAGSFAVTDGVAATKDLALEAEGASGKGDGRINLPDWYMEFECGFTFVAASGAPPFYLRLKGPPDAPRKFLEANEFQEWLRKREAASAPKPARKPPAPSAASSSERIINQLLKEPPTAP